MPIRMGRSVFVLTLLLLIVLQVKDSAGVAFRNCVRGGRGCSPLYLCPCCPKLYFTDGSDGGVKPNQGFFCNMDNAHTNSSDGYPFPQGCCQGCTSEGDGCTTAASPCCPDMSPESDPSCEDGQTMCMRINTNNTLNNANKIPLECDGKRPPCLGEGQFCSGTSWTCCEGTSCNRSAVEGDFGICQRTEGYTGELPPSPTPRPEPTGVATDATCWNYGLTTSEPPTTTAITTSTTTTEIRNGSILGCAGEKEHCDTAVCCDDLECPRNWWPLRILRWFLNFFGLWYRVCKDYPPFKWYNPCTWFHI